MDKAPSWQSVTVAVATIALVGLFFVVGLQETDDTDDFLTLWGGVGTVVGVVAGAIPSFFFKAQADRANARRVVPVGLDDLVREHHHLERVVVSDPGLNLGGMHVGHGRPTSWEGCQ